MGAVICLDWTGFKSHLWGSEVRDWGTFFTDNLPSGDCWAWRLISSQCCVYFTGPHCIVLPPATMSKCVSSWWSREQLCLRWPTVTCRRLQTSVKRWRKATLSAPSSSMVCSQCRHMCWLLYPLPLCPYGILKAQEVFYYLLYIILRIGSPREQIRYSFHALPRKSYCQRHLQLQLITGVRSEDLLLWL